MEKKKFYKKNEIWIILMCINIVAAAIVLDRSKLLFILNVIMVIVCAVITHINCHNDNNDKTFFS